MNAPIETSAGVEAAVEAATERRDGHPDDRGDGEAPPVEPADGEEGAGFGVPEDPELRGAMIDVLEEALRRIRVAQEMPGAHSCAIDAHVVGLIQELENAPPVQEAGAT